MMGSTLPCVSGSLPRGMMLPGMSNSAQLLGLTSNGSDASRVNKAVRGDVVDLAARSTYIH